ncbi:MAG: S-adenosylmethionine:tRNA ribosyltransferase-isomerase [Flavobacteriaceae bacterium]
MVINRKDKTIKHQQFKDLINYFEEEDVLIIKQYESFFLLDYMEIKKKTGARIEVFFC